MFAKGQFELPSFLTDAFLALEVEDGTFTNSVLGFGVCLESFNTIYFVGEGRDLFTVHADMWRSGFHTDVELDVAKNWRELLLRDLFKDGFIFNIGVGERLVVNTGADTYTLRDEVVGRLRGNAWIDQGRSDTFSIECAYDLYRAMTSTRRRRM